MSEGPETWRLHVYPSWWRLIMAPPIVNARLEGDDREAESVRREIERRINKSRRQQPEEGPARAPKQRWW